MWSKVRVIESRTPGELRLVTIADSHFCSLSPPSWKLDYWKTQQEALETLERFIKKQNVTAVLWAGDVFHRKSVTKNPLWFVTEVATWMLRFREAGAENIGIAGNHDLLLGCLKGLGKQPLDTLVKLRIFHLLDDSPVRINVHPVKGGGYTGVQIVGESYNHGRADGVRDMKKWPLAPNDPMVALGHFWFGAQTGEFFGEHLYGPDFFEKSEADVFVIGHHHDDQGIVTVKDKTYVAVGALTRTGVHKGDLGREPHAGYLVFKDGKLSQSAVLKPKFPTVEDSLDAARYEEMREENKKLEDFVRNLQGISFSSVSEPKDYLAEMMMPDKVREKATYYLDMQEKS